VVSHWSLADETEEWGEPAMPRSAVLTHCILGLSKVIAWLASAPGPLPRSLPAPAAAAFRRNSLMLCTQVGVADRPCFCSPADRARG